ncbi:MAG: nuclear transport factor 2 family protein [Gammaproteobacteria bacterium]|nr:nuclear transport factor 2 family protein [Gammaproteobacteria bacterium]
MSLVFTSTAFADLIEDVRCREIGFSKSVEAQDRELFASFIDPDARFVGNSVSHGPDAIAEAWSVFFAEDGPTIKWRPQFVEVLEDGELALTRGPYQMIATNEQGEEIEYWGTFNSVWRRNANGEWRVVFDAGSESNEAPPDEVKALLDQEDNCGD